MKLLLLLLSIAAYAQPEVRTSQKNADVGFQYKTFDDGTNITVLCKALSLQPTSESIAIDSATNASPVVFTVTAGHGLDTSSRPNVTISGGTGSWATVNGTRTATLLSATTFSIPVNTTSTGAVTGTLAFTTRAPRLTMPVWSVLVSAWSGALFKGSYWYNGSSSALTTCTAAPTQYQ